MRRTWSPLVATIVTISSVKSDKLEHVNRLLLPALTSRSGFMASRLLKPNTKGLMTCYKIVAVKYDIKQKMFVTRFPHHT